MADYKNETIIAKKVLYILKNVSPNVKEINKCGECDKLNTKYCKRCNEYFCSEHIKTHLTTRVCIQCNIEKCIETFILFNKNIRYISYNI